MSTNETTFGGYRVTDTLGAGAISTIYKAVHEPTGRVVALKALKNEIAPTSSFGEQLDREAKILADLTHPNVVLLLESGRLVSGRPWLALEIVDGPTLSALLAKKTKLAVPHALAIACGVCAALEHVHERGVIHRDVKPSNVLLARSGIVKVVDFGIAQRARTASLSDALGTEGITPSGRMAPEVMKDAFGTPAYMSPEQILGDFVDARSDLFSLGVVLYQMLCGARPFEGGEKDKKSAAQRIRRDTTPPLRDRAAHVPRQVERIVMRLIEKAPSERYPNASAARERLESALRAITRDDPASLVRAALADAGFAKVEPRRDAPTATEIAAAPRMRRAIAGYAAIALAFAGGVLAIEGTSWSSRDGKARSGLELAPENAGGLRVVATPWADVKVDGQHVETTPFARAIPLAPGRHWVTLSHPDAPDEEREVHIASGETVTVDVTMNLGGDADGGSTRDGGKDAR
jgi:serine/threonine-protein kinase